MNRIHFLVIDDEFLDRKGAYENLASEIRKANGIEVRLDFLERPSALRSKLKQNVYGAVILDAVFDSGDEWDGFSVRRAFDEIGNDTPVALLSSRWDSTNSEQLNYGWQQGNCKTFLHFRDIDGSDNGKLQYAIAQLSGLISEHLDVRFDLSLSNNETLRILHISDLQMGGIESRKLALEAGRMADAVLEKWQNKGPSFIAFTGDITEHGRPDEYDKAYEWVDSFLTRLKMEKPPTSRLLVVPGNHDVNLGLGASGRIALKEKGSTKELTIQEKVVDSTTNRFAFAPFHEFRKRISDRGYLPDQNKQSLAWVEGRYRHLGIIFYGINTATPVNEFGLPDHEVDANALDSIKHEIGQLIEYGSDGADQAKPIVIGLVHHSPFSAHSDRGITNPETFHSFLSGRIKTSLILHGHVHEHSIEFKGNTRTIVSSASTMTKEAGTRPRDSLRGFNVIDIHRHDGVPNNVETKAYEWIGSEFSAIGKRHVFRRQKDGLFVEVFE